MQLPLLLRKCKNASLITITGVACHVLIVILLLSGCSGNQNDKRPVNQGGDLETGEALMQQSLFDSALVYYNRVARNGLKTGSWDIWYKGTAGLIDCYRAKGNFEEAFRIANQAQQIASGRGDTSDAIYAGILHKKAVILTDKGDYTTSSSVLSESILIRSRGKENADTAMALSYNILGNNNLFQGEYDKALENYLKAITLFKDRKNSADLATINQNAGIVYALKGDYDNAKNFFHEALTINQAVIPANDPKLALMYLNYGRYYSLIDNDREALEMYNKAESIFRKSGDKSTKNLAPLYHNIGNIYANTADYDKALLYFNKALSLYQSLSSEGEQNIPAVLSNIGFVYEREGNYQQALKYYLQSVEKGKNTQNKVTIYRNLANIYYIIKQPENAFLYYDLALDASLSAFGPDHPETALTYLKFGEFLSLTGRDHEAITDLNKGLQVYQKLFGSKNPQVAAAYKYLGNHYTRKNNFEKALNCFQQSLIAGFANFNKTEAAYNPAISKSEVNYFMLNSLSGKAFALRSLYLKNHSRTDYLVSSADAYDVSISTIEMLRSSYQDEDSKLLMAGNEKWIFQNAIQVNSELYNRYRDKKYLIKALELSEKSKSAVLLSNIRNLEAKEVGKIPAKLRIQENKLKEEIGLYEKLVYDEKSKANADAQKINFWNNKIFELNKWYDSLIVIFEKEYPAYYKIKYDNSVLGLSEIQRKLKDNQAVIEYTMDDESYLFAFVITRRYCTLKHIPLDSLFFSDINTLTGQMAGKSFNNFSQDDFTSFVSASRRLFEKLIPEEISEHLPPDLIIIPDGELGYLSFDVLLTEKPSDQASGYRNLPYLIKKCAINYAPSATMLFGELSNKGKPGHDVLAFAPSYDNLKGIPINLMMNRQSAQNYLLPIPGAQIEVDNLKKIFNCKVYQNNKATKDNFRKFAGDYSILHLAMHTLIDDKNPLYSKLVFYQDKKPDDNGLLNAYELFNMQLKAQLAVLSACNTGRGKLVSGEGILSLSRGFFYAGVPSIIMTLWAVEDRSGADLMTSFYHYLSEGKAKNEALRLAKLDYLKSSDQIRSHPHFWAAYLSIGNTDPVQDIGKPVSSAKYILGSAFILAVVVATFWAYRRRRRSSL